MNNLNTTPTRSDLNKHLGAVSKMITCLRCSADFGPQTQKPKAPDGVSYTLTARDYIIHLCPATDMICWIWRWSRVGDGYASVWHNGRVEYVGRILLGVLDTDLQQIHACDNRCCVNPVHLRAGTQAENMSDMAAKGRSNRGSRRYFSKLTEADIPVIRACLAAGESQRGIARRYGVNKTVISDINHGVTWKHVP